MGGVVTFNDNDDVQLKGATDATLIGNVGDSLKTVTVDVAPANGSITVLDIGTSSLVGANGQVFYFGTPTTSSAAIFALSSQETVSIQVNIIGAGGTLVVDISADGGSFWLRPNVFQPSTSSYTNGFTAPFIAIVATAGMTHIRVRSTSSWSGVATVIVRESVNSRNITISDPLPGITGTISLPTGASTLALQTTGNSSLSSIDTKLSSQATAANQTTELASLASVDTKLSSQATAANQSSMITALQLIDNPIGSSSGGTAGTSSLQVGGIFNTVLPTLTNGQQAAVQLDSSGRTILAPITAIPTDGTRTTYSATFTGLLSAALTTDLFTISGSATKLVRILQIGFSATAASDTKVNTVLIKRSAANTGGTSTTATLVPHDSSAAAATVAVRGYTINPSALGAAVGTVRTVKFDAIGTSTVVPMVQLWEFGNRPSQALVLRGAAEFLCLNLSGTTVTTPSFNIWIEWTEE